MPTTIISRTFFPAISSIQKDTKNVVRIFKLFLLSLILIWPLLIILITSSEHLLELF